MEQALAYSSGVAIVEGRRSSGDNAKEQKSVCPQVSSSHRLRELAFDRARAGDSSRIGVKYQI